MQHRYKDGFPAGPSGAASAVSRPAEHPASLAQSKILRDQARQIRFSRDLRQKSFGRNIFGEPAWDILLALYVIDSDQRRLSTRQISTLASQPLTTALRWLDYLEAEDLVTRRSNPFDQRMVYVELSDKGRAAMDGYLTQMQDAHIFGPIAIGER
jgi:DNA-binding MarR family transcriptional regulator